jgi:hypothetical protein
MGRGDPYDSVRDLPVEVTSVSLSGRSADTSYGFTRPTTVVRMDGPEAVGVGEDVTTDPDDHDRFQREGVGADLTGTYTVRELSDRFADLGPVASDDDGWAKPGRARRWALESAALELALRQADETLGDRLDRTYDPVRFVVSLRLTDPPRLDPVREWLAVDPSLEFKLDVAPDWDRGFVADVAAEVGDAVRVLDFKAQYEDDRAAADLDLYGPVAEAFPGAVLEDPADATLVDGGPLVDETDRVSFDAPISGVAAVETAPVTPRWLNVKPARFGTVRSLLETVAHARERDVSLYGGGMFELDRGRPHLHSLASLLYPDGPNDVAPPGYNVPDPHPGVPPSPLDPPVDPVGLGY